MRKRKRYFVSPATSAGDYNEAAINQGAGLRRHGGAGVDEAGSIRVGEVDRARRI